MSFDLGALRAAIAAHGRVVRVVIAGHQGSSPREAGAAMLVWEDGQSGTIGGGALEFEAAKAARGLTRSCVARVPLGPALGQCCGGAVTLVSELFDAKTELPEDGLYARRVEGRAPMPLSLKRAARDARGQGAARLIFEDGWLAEPVAPPARPLWIYGAGHVGRALVDVLAPMPEFAITWVDTGPERFPSAVAEGVQVLPTVNPAEAVGLPPSDAAHLVLTYSHALDLELCHRLLLHGFGWAGLIGSATKWARFKSRLMQLGHENAQITRICCPIGQPSLGKHPQAIAIGVGAQLLSLRRQERGAGDEDLYEQPA